MNKNIPILRLPFAQARKEQVLAILAEGKAARFVLPQQGIWKDVREWNEDADGDLTAFRVGGGRTDNPPSAFLCWYNNVYVVSAVDMVNPEPLKF